jgi:radical SAM superfamily enzyme YgiQ (UPF0313 family)
LPFSLDNWIIDKIEASNPDIVAFSILTDNYGWCLKIARLLRKRLDVPTVWGGIHATSVPEHVLSQDCVDYVIIGEGEYALLDLVESLSQGQADCSIANLGYKKNGKPVINPVRRPIANLDELPFPDKDLWFSATLPSTKRRYITLGIRGCPFRCTYCNGSFIKRLYKDYPSQLVRYRSVGNVMEELKLAKKTWKPAYIFFCDELITANRKWFEKFVKAYADEIGIPFFSSIHPVTITTKTIRLLEKANCREVSMGVQTIREETRERYLHRKYSNERLVELIDAFAKTPIFLQAGIILNLPGQSIEEMTEIARFLAKHKVDFPAPYWLRYYPKTEIVDIAKKMGILSQKDVDNLESSTGYNPVSVTTKHDNPDILRIRNLILLTPLLPSKWIEQLVTNKYFTKIPKFDLFQITVQLTVLTRRLFYKKRHLPESFTLFEYLCHISHYITKKISYQLSRKL